MRKFLETFITFQVAYWLGIGWVTYRHQCPPPTRLHIQRHWQEVHGYGEIQNTLDSKMLDRCSMECQPEYWEMMEVVE